MGLTRKEDVTEELKPHRLKKNSKDLGKVIKSIEETMNPFSLTLNKEHLFNIATGKNAEADTSAFLLDVFSIGSKARDEFVQCCIKDSNYFSNPIKRQKIKNFASEAGRRTKTT